MGENIFNHLIWNGDRTEALDILKSIRENQYREIKSSSIVMKHRSDVIVITIYEGRYSYSTFNKEGFGGSTGEMWPVSIFEKWLLKQIPEKL